MGMYCTDIDTRRRLIEPKNFWVANSVTASRHLCRFIRLIILSARQYPNAGICPELQQRVLLLPGTHWADRTVIVAHLTWPQANALLKNY